MLATVPVQASGGCWHQPTRATGGGNTDGPCLATGKLVWQCGDHTVKLESAACRRFLFAKICGFRGTWHDS